MCLYPRTIQNKKYQPNEKNGGIIPTVYDYRALHIQIPCENCMECRNKKAREWQIRLQEDIKENTGGKFITLTFSNEKIHEIHTKIMQESPENWGMKGYELDNKIAKYAMRHFNENYRKKYKKALRHWVVTELGHKGTENIHLHGIIWPTGIDKKGNKCTMEIIEKLWQYGWVWKYKLVGEVKLNYVNNRTINYIVKYVSKRDELHQHYKSIILTSPGIGKNYTNTSDATRNKFNWEDTREYYKTESGHKISLPKYWRNKIYNDEEREILWMQNLNKETAYVCGIKISTKYGKHQLFNMRKEYRKKNRRLGYGYYNKDHDRLQWEEQRRSEKLMQRLTAARKTIQNDPVGVVLSEAPMTGP